MPVVRILVIGDPHIVLAGLEAAHERGVDLAETDVVLLGETGDGQRGIRTGHHTHQELTAAAHLTAMVLIGSLGVQLPCGELDVRSIDHVDFLQFSQNIFVSCLRSTHIGTRPDASVKLPFSVCVPLGLCLYTFFI